MTSWDEYGNVVPDAPKISWDEHGNPIGATPPPTAEATGNPVSRFLGAAAENLIPEAIRHPSMLADVPGAFRDVVSAQIQEGDPSVVQMPGVRPMVQAALQGIGHQSAASYQNQRAQGASVPVAALAGIPIIGAPAAQAGEELGSGRIAEGLGHTVGLLAPFAAGPVAKMAGRGVEGAVGLLKPAEEQYSQALGATTRANKATSARVVPGLLDRGVTAMTRKGLMAKFEAGTAAASEALDEALQNVPAAQKVDTLSAYNRLDKLKDEHLIKDSSGAFVPANAQAAQSLEAIQALQDSIINGDASFGNVRKLRQVLDRQVVAGGKAFGRTIREGSQLDVTREGANALRNELAKVSPDVAAANKELTFWLNAKQVLGATLERTSSQATPLSQTIAQGAGAAGALASGSGLAKSVITGQAFKLMKALTTSTAWKTTSAVSKYNLSKMLVNGDIEGATQLGGRILAGSEKDVEE